MARFSLKLLSFFAITFVTASCISGHHAESNVRNDSSTKLEVTFEKDGESKTVTIPAHTTQTITTSTEKGAGKDFDCCLCELETVSIKSVDSTKTVIKSITSESNWNLDNPNKRKMDSKIIICEFVVGDSDVQ